VGKSFGDINRRTPQVTPMPLWRSARAQFGVVFLGFLLLVGSSATATFLTVHTQADDARVINMVGRQRMLTQKMTWLALAQPDSPDLAASMRLFEQTQRALRDGGTTLDETGQPVTLPPAPDAALRSQLDDMAQDWAAFRSYLQPADPAALQAQSPHILAHLAMVVSEFEVRAEAKVARLQLIQLIFVVAALGLLAWGYLITQRRLIRRLAVLRTVTRRIASGNLADPVPPMGDDELGELGRAFETMRVEVATAHDQLETRVAQGTRELATAFEFSQEIVAQPDLERLLHSVADRARTLVQAQSDALCLLDKDGTTLVLAASSGEGATVASLPPLIQGESACPGVRTGQMVVTQSASTACRFLLAHTPGLCAIAPLHAGKTALGALCVVRGEDNPFNPDETRALTLLANSVAIAIANARLYQQAKQLAVMEERQRLARELHDSATQSLYSLMLFTEAAREWVAAGELELVQSHLERVGETAHQALKDMRLLVYELRPAVLESEGLIGALQRRLSAVEKRSGVDASFVVECPIELAATIEEAFYHIAKEALNNALKHAQASVVTIYLRAVDESVELEVIDNGKGFDFDAVKDRGGMGLNTMRERMEKIGGSLTVASAPGEGTRVCARVRYDRMSGFH
jgi:nitrate/nitrite-specific signal transduction histidine kinase